MWILCFHLRGFNHEKLEKGELKIEYYEDQLITGIDSELFLKELREWKSETENETIRQTLDTVLDLFYYYANWEIMR